MWICDLIRIVSPICAFTHLYFIYFFCFDIKGFNLRRNPPILCLASQKKTLMRIVLLKELIAHLLIPAKMSQSEVSKNSSWWKSEKQLSSELTSAPSWPVITACNSHCSSSWRKRRGAGDWWTAAASRLTASLCLKHGPNLVRPSRMWHFLQVWAEVWFHTEKGAC